MRKRRLQAEKPKILKFKIEICTKLMKKVIPYELSHNGYGWTYYQASYTIGDFDITVLYQRYVRNMFKVDYIKIYNNKNNSKQLTKTKLTELNDLIENENINE